MSPLPAGPYHPTGELVAEAWLGQNVPGLTPAIVGMTLPSDVTKWIDTGFLQLAALPTGVPDVDLPVRHTILTLDGWGCTLTTGQTSSVKPAWMLAARLIELVRVATEDEQTGKYGRPVTMREGYRSARVQAAYLITEPLRVRDDPSGYGRFTADLAIDWVPA